MSKSDVEIMASEGKPTNVYTGRGTDSPPPPPCYPAAAIDAILNGLGEPLKFTASDIDAGTGISSRLLADRGVHVMAVEPNASMRRAAVPNALIELVGRAGAQTAAGIKRVIPRHKPIGTPAPQFQRRGISKAKDTSSPQSADRARGFPQRWRQRCEPPHQGGRQPVLARVDKQRVTF